MRARRASAGCGSRTRVAWLEARGPAPERTPRRNVAMEAEGGGFEPPRLFARPRSRRLPSPKGLPFRSLSTGGRNRTCELLLNREAHEPAHATPVLVVRLSRGGRIRTGGLLLPKQADCQAFPHPDRLSDKCPAGIEPALPPWQGSRLPLQHGHACRYQIVKDCREHRVGLEPTSPHYGCGVLAAGRPVPPFATNRDAPEKTGTGTSRTRSKSPFSPLINLLTRPPDGTRGTRTLTYPVKSRVCCR